MVIHHLATFGGHWSNGSGEMKCLLCHVTSENPVIEVSSIFMSGNSSWYVTKLPSFVAIGTAVVEICF